MPLNYLTKRPVDIPPDSHVVLSVVRNELLRLPYLLSYHRSIGFDHFIFVDNGSSDGTREFLLNEPDTFVFHTDENFGAGLGDGVSWKNAILDRFCDRRWVLVADADEILVWPGSERENIRMLSKKMEASGAEALFTLMLDMYADKPFGEIGYAAGMPFLDYAPYFDRGPYRIVMAQRFPRRQIYGGVRARLFKAYGEAASREQAGSKVRISSPTVSKVPFLRWRSGQRFIRAQHMLYEAVSLAPMRGALLHFKMFDDLPIRCEIEIARGEHFEHGQEYRVLGAIIRNYNGKSFFDPAHSVRYQGTDQLVSLGLMDSSKPF